MNIFQIIGDEQQNINIQDQLQELLKFQQTWVKFKDIVQRLFKNSEFITQEVQELWINIQKESNQMSETAIKYYFDLFDKHFQEDYLKNIQLQLQQQVQQEQKDFLDIMEKLTKRILTHQQFITVLQQNQINKNVNIQQILSTKVYIILKEEANIDKNIETFIESQLALFTKFVVGQQNHLNQLIPQQQRVKLQVIQGEFNIDNIERFFQISMELDFMSRIMNIMRKVLENDLKQFIQQQSDHIDDFNPFYATIQAYYTNLHENLLKLISEILKSLFEIQDQPNQYQNNNNNINIQQQQISIQIKQQMQVQILKQMILIQQSLQETILEQYAKLCISKIFDIVLNYPDSHPIVLELKQSIDSCQSLLLIASELETQIHKRLLIPGVITQTILNYYINCLKLMQILDPKGITFERVTGPIKKYLLERDDTIRCIISHLTESDQGQGYGQLIKQRVQIPESNKEQLDFSSDEDEAQAEKWEIQSLVHKKNELIKIKYMESDLLSILVNLYGSQEAFIKEYQNMLSEKMMGTKETNIDEEFKNLELLKLRCGDQNLQECNVILKDVRDSKKIDQNIHNDFKESVTGINLENNLISFDQIHCIFVSKGYWQINYDQEEIELPDKLKPFFDEYIKRYETTKQQRKLNLHSNLGYVQLSLSFDNGDFDFKCPPAQALLISYFDETQYDLKNGLSAQWLSDQTKIPLNTLKQKMTFWIHNGVIKEKKEQSANFKKQQQYDIQNVTYLPVDVYQKYDNEDTLVTCEEEENELILRDQSSGGFESQHFTKVVEDILYGIIRRSGPKTSEKLLNLCKTVYKPDIGIIVQKSQINDILKGLVQQHRLYFNGELFGIVEQ